MTKTVEEKIENQHINETRDRPNNVVGGQVWPMSVLIAVILHDDPRYRVFSAFERFRSSRL